MKQFVRLESTGLALTLMIAVAAGCSSSNAGTNGGPDIINGGAPVDAGPPSQEAGPKPATGPIQMNDVSILLPLPRSPAEIDSYLKPSANGVGGALLPQALYDAATGEDSGQPPIPGSMAPMPYDSLRVVAIRLDPCFANVGPVTDPSSCKNQIRLVLQPLLARSAGGTDAVDAGVHAFYSLTREALLEIVDAIASLRVASGATGDLGPLAVHPIVAREGADGPFARGLFGLVTAHAGAANLVRFTRFQSAQRLWTFSGFDVAAGTTTPMVIPTLPGGTTNVSFFQGFGADVQGSFTPPTAAADDMQLLGNMDLAKAASDAARKAAFDAALRIENPSFHSPTTIDCASCHAAGPARALVASGFGLAAAGNPNAFSTTSPFVPSSDLAQTTDLAPPADGIDLHIFSYLGPNPTIAPRVIHETATVVDYLGSLRK